MKSNYKSIILAISLFFALSVSVSAAPGNLDPTFGTGGIVVSTGGDVNTLEFAYATAIQTDGKIVVVGYGAGGSTWDLAVARYNTNGSLDTSFGSRGVVLTDISSGAEYASSVAIQTDGKIVVTGYTYFGYYFVVVRYNPNGSLDTTFNGTGKVITPIDNAYSFARSVAIQADGKIVVAGNSGNSSDPDLNHPFTLVRYNTNGSLDTSFAHDGIVTTWVDSSYGAAYAVAIQADGKIVAAGNCCSNDLAVVRYNADGSLDTTFNGTGKVTTPGSGAWSVAIQADGKILIASGPLTTSENRLVRYNANGTLDTSFNATGIVAVGISVNSAVVQADGKIVAAGSAANNQGGDFAAARFNPNGSPDTTFDFDGIVTTPVNVNASDFAAAVAIQADGKIVLAGSADSGFNHYFDFALVRYQGGSNANIRTRFDFDGDGRADVSVFRPNDRVWYLNQSTNGFSATQFGLSSDKITPADFDGDGKTDIAVYRDGTWWRINSSNSTVIAVPFGVASDIPVPADYSGDGRDELAVYRGGTWWMLNLANDQVSTVQFGLTGDKLVPADYDGDGLADQAVYRNGEWHLNRSTQGHGIVYWGLATDKPVPADYDGDGKTDPAVYRDGTWYLQQSLHGWGEFQWGIAPDMPAPADFDGDGRADAAVYRNGTWYLRQSTTGVSIQQFGMANDKPVPAAYLP